MTADALRAAIEAGTTPALLDVRTRAEFTEGHIPGAQHIPFNEIAFRAGEIDSPRDAPLIVYCGHGPRAWMAGVALRLRGFKRVEFLRGHWSAWVRAELPTTR